MECARTGPNGATNWQRDENGSENKYAGVGVATGICVGGVIVAATDDMGVWLAFESVIVGTRSYRQRPI